ncbi:MAG: type II toxin-antitoxin system PemK/MazF family toxin [Microthrixaceae bacterium]|nr:type II toxin-antitoxin system PemK/MazF family toxin [Microthrixaceae bacterium]
MSTPRHGEIWWAEAENQRRPVLVVTRSDAVAVLNRIIVAPVTRTVRSIPTEIPLGPDNGLNVECAASFDNLQPVRPSFLTDRVGSLGAAQSGEICRALAALADC